MGGSPRDTAVFILHMSPHILTKHNLLSLIQLRLQAAKPQNYILYIPQSSSSF